MLYLTAIIALITVGVIYYAIFFGLTNKIKSDAQYKTHVANLLKESSYFVNYQRYLKRGLSFLSTWMGDADSWSGNLHGIFACYIMAMAYTTFFFIASWTLGGSGKLGNDEIMSDVTLLRRILTMMGILGSLALFCLLERWGKFIILLLVTAGIAFGQVAFILTPIAVAFLLAGWTLVIRNLSPEIFDSSFIGTLGTITIVGTLVVFAISWPPKDDVVVGHLLLAVLPMVNMIVDWPSWWISRKLGHHLLESSYFDMSDLKITGVIASHVLIDVAVAVLLFFGLAAVMSFTIELLNFWFVLRGSTSIVDLPQFINQSIEYPWPNAIWIALMLLSTLVPTMMHFSVLVASPLALWLIPNDRRLEVAKDLTARGETDPRAVGYAAWHQIRFWTIAVGAPIAILSLVVWAAGKLIGSIAEHLAWAANVGIWLAHQITNG